MRLDPARLKAIIFDVDGTLYRQSRLRRAMLLRLLRVHAAQPRQGLATLRILSAYRRAQEALRGRPVDGDLASAQVRWACERAGVSEEAARLCITRWMEQEPLPLLRRNVAPGLLELLQAARERGLRLGVFSDYPPVAKLDAMGLSDYFDAVVTAQDPAVNAFKPNPCGLVEALRRLGVAPVDALYVGDRAEVDAAAAKAAGVPCAILNRKRRGGPTSTWIEVAHYGELHALLFRP